MPQKQWTFKKFFLIGVGFLLTTGLLFGGEALAEYFLQDSPLKQWVEAVPERPPAYPGAFSPGDPGEDKGRSYAGHYREPASAGVGPGLLRTEFHPGRGQGLRELPGSLH